MNETILPVDFQRAGMISDDVIAEKIVQNLPEGVRLTALMDSCHSGSGLDLPFVWQPSGRGFHQRGGGSWREETNPYHSAGDVQLFSGCADDQTSADVCDPYSQPGGAMTTAFCAALRRNPCPTYADLLDTMNAEMHRKGYSQRPQLSSSQRFEFNRPFILSDIVPNQNAKFGRTFRRKFPPQPREIEGPLADMLGLAVAVGAAVVADQAIGHIGGMLFRMAFGGGDDE